MGTFFKLGKAKAAKREGLAPPFISCAQDTVGPGFIHVREMSGKFKNFQGQGIVREFHNLSGKIEFLLKCQGNVREF